MNIPYFLPYYNYKEYAYMFWALSRKRKLVKSTFIKKFENRLREITGKKYAIAINNATSALHLLVTYSSQNGEYVVTTPYTYIASANIGLYEKKKIIFCDIDKETLLIDLNSLNKIIEKYKGNISAVVLVDIFGSIPENMQIKELCRENNIFLIEDSAQSIGSINNGIKSGSFGDAAVISFHENKQFTTAGEGGAIVTDNEDLYNYLVSAHDQGRVIVEDWKEKMILGFNYRMTEVQAAFGLSQLSRFGNIISRRNEIAEIYIRELGEIKDLYFLKKNNGVHSWFTFPVFCKDEKSAKYIELYLNRNQIGNSRTYFIPLYNLAPHKDAILYCDKEFCDSLFNRTICLPLFYGLTNKQVLSICNVIKDSFKHFNDESINFYDNISENYHVIATSNSKYLNSVDQRIKDSINSNTQKWLDVGSGDGKRIQNILKQINSRNINTTLVDNSTKMCELIREISEIDNVENIDVSLDKITEKYDLITMLYNVLGHIQSKELRLSALINMKAALNKGGVLIFDVNNRFNAKHYGLKSSIKNYIFRKADFIVHKKGVSGQEFCTRVHLFSKKEIEKLLNLAGISNYEMSYLDYGNGEEVNSQFSGQILVKVYA